MDILSSKITSQFPFPKIQCPNHPKDFVAFINFDENSKYQLICSTCIQDLKLNIQKLVQVQSFFNEKDDECNSQIIKNLTPIIPTSEENDLLENVEVQMKQTTEYFNEFKQRINNIIDQSFKEALNDIKQLNSYRNNVMDMYNSLSKKTEIKFLIEKHSNNTPELEKQFKVLIQEKNNSSNQDQKVLQELLALFIVKKNKIDINHIKNKLNSCEQSLKRNIKKYNIKEKQIDSFEKIINTQNLDQEVSLNLKVNQQFSNIQDNQCKQLADKLGECVNIESLNLYLLEQSGFTNITSEGCVYLAEGIRKCKQLQSFALNIGKNDIRDEGVIELCKGISQHHGQLLELNLDMSYNNIGDKGLYAVADLIKQSKNITDLKLDFFCNQITDNGILSIIETLKQFQQLSLWIKFSSNQIKNKEQHKKNIQSINSIIIKSIQF